VKRAFLARGTGRAGGIGNPPAVVATPPKSKKSKSINPAHRSRVGQDLIDRLNNEGKDNLDNNLPNLSKHDYGRDHHSSIIEDSK
jgi:hypothetical protein